ncbi:MAG TPA: ParB/RepB/Spo0J family partition protein [Candidatus Saccharibacteria bacterium]|nr:ParB/RepB/Spo0J family partition protein [Candidatus Saccharibacteria bacterium]
MSAKKPTGLGRGFASLIPTDVLDETFDPTADGEQSSELRNIKHSDITPNPDQPRRHFDDEALEELAASIREHGIIQPLVVTPQGGSYQIVAGERRWRAAGIAGLEKVPAIIRTLSEQHKLELALIENLQRRDLNPLETATAYLKLHNQFNLTYEEIGHRVGGKAVSTISNVLRLLQLPADAKQALVEGQISEGHARQLLALDDDAAKTQLLKLIIREGWSVRKTEQYVVGYKRGEIEDTKQASAIKNTRQETDFTKSLSQRLSLPVVQKTTAKGGQIIISYNSDDELEALKQKFL